MIPSLPPKQPESTRGPMDRRNKLPIAAVSPTAGPPEYIPVVRQNPVRIEAVDFPGLGVRHFLSIILMILRPLSLIPTTLRLRSDLALENLSLRQQLAVLNRRHRRPKLRRLDRLFWLVLSRSREPWKETLVIVKPETVLRWHRRRFTSYWTRLSGHNGPGRPGKEREIRELIRKMAKSNPLWCAPRVHGELLKLGINISERSVSRWMPRRTKPPSQNWRAFLDNHIGELVSIDFFTVPTATFRILSVLIVLAHDRRRIVHFNVTDHPTAEWTAQQMVEAIGDGESPRYLIRDRDGLYRLTFRDRVKALDIEEVVIAPRSPWQRDHASYCTS